MNATQKLLQQHHFQFRHNLGQNFILDEEILTRIVDSANLPADALVLEIGAGAGTLTRALAQRCEKVVALEVDDHLMPILQVTLEPYQNTVVLHRDILKTDLRVLWREQFCEKPFYVVANLPYYITTPVLMMLLEPDLPIPGVTVMVQKEVAHRIAAQPGGKEYGALTVAVQYRMAAKIAFDVPAQLFSPPPKVDSAVVVCRRLPEPPVSTRDEQLFFRVVRAAFAMRRKTMVNNLCAAFPMDKQQAQALLSAIGAEPNVRGEALSMQQMADIADRIAAAFQQER